MYTRPTTARVAVHRAAAATGPSCSAPRRELQCTALQCTARLAVRRAGRQLHYLLKGAAVSADPSPDSPMGGAKGKFTPSRGGATKHSDSFMTLLRSEGSPVTIHDKAGGTVALPRGPQSMESSNSE